MKMKKRECRYCYTIKNTTRTTGKYICDICSIHLAKNYSRDIRIVFGVAVVFGAVAGFVVGTLV